ncbi:MAG TPA: GNAT family N-acetyltransferase, partial [Thermomicrobiales bacterium]|nr:GNAT family N-acetyltransferase [Thermomicrobiales bacterium]
LVEARYATRIAGTDTTRSFIIEIDGEPAGYIQCYRLVDEPEYLRQLELPLPLHRNAVGTDLFIGEPARRNHGWGVPILRAFHRRIVFGEMRADPAIIAPEPGNARAIKVYERVGFRWFRTVPIEDIEHPENSGDEYVMILSRSMFERHDGQRDE